MADQWKSPRRAMPQGAWPAEWPARICGGGRKPIQVIRYCIEGHHVVILSPNLMIQIVLINTSQIQINPSEWVNQTL